MTAPRRESKPRPLIGATLISARSLAEYRVMFALTNDDLERRILDCPGGAASVVTDAAQFGQHVVAVDPVYAAGRTWLAGHAVEEAIRGNVHTAAAYESYVWSFFTDAADHRRKRVAAAERFGADLMANPQRYVAGALPDLPFRDGAFDLVLSSHLLFMYADRLDEEFHVHALREMVRVARGEVRVFPLLADSGALLLGLRRQLMEALRGDGMEVEIRPSAYEFQRHGTEMMIVRGDIHSSA